MMSTLINNLLFFRYSSSNLRTGVLALSDLSVAFRLGMALNKITTTIKAAMYSISPPGAQVKRNVHSTILLVFVEFDSYIPNFSFHLSFIAPNRLLYNICSTCFNQVEAVVRLLPCTKPFRRLATVSFFGRP